MPADSIFDGPTNKSTFNIEPFDRNLFTCSCEGGTSLNDFTFGTFIDPFPSDGAASMAVKGLTSLEAGWPIRDGDKRGK